MDDTTSPGGKTQEELDAEEASELQDELDELREELESFRKSNHALILREVRLGDELRALRLKTFRWPHLFATVVMLLLLLATSAMVRSVTNSVTAHLDELRPPAVECPVCEPPAPPVAPPAPAASTASTGYFVEGEFGGPSFVPWPDASGYPAEVFTEDCRAICAVPAPLDGPDEPGRVLVVDPEHLLCICFHPESSFPITRWINWERTR